MLRISLVVLLEILSTLLAATQLPAVPLDDATAWTAGIATGPAAVELLCQEDDHEQEDEVCLQPVRTSGSVAVPIAIPPLLAVDRRFAFEEP